MELDKLYRDNCQVVLETFPDNSVDFIFTSPPYADNRRKSPYQGVKIEEYVEWFLPISNQLKRVLKPEGSFVLNIKERAVHGERQTYVLQLILSMKEQGWYWIDEYIWHKKNCYPGKWPNRFRDAWERCLHFTKEKKFKMFQEAVMVPMGDWKEKRLTKLSEKDRTRHESKVSSGLGRNVSNWVEREMAYPTNVLHLPTECSNRNHSAAFPKELPMWFIRLFTEEGNVVLDPFIGSGTTAIACLLTNRHFLGIEAQQECYKIAYEAISMHMKRSGGGDNDRSYK
jgi:site-specific DNA-methyltransferase (adenine-specific)